MTRIVDHNYGANIDGRGGKTVVDYELTMEDDEIVRDLILDKLEGYYADSYPSNITIEMVDHYSRDIVEFYVDVYDYFYKDELEEILGFEDE